MTLPPIKNIDHVSFPPPDTRTLPNGIPAYTFTGAQNDIIRIDLLFDCGRWTEQAPLIADALSVLIKSGTSELTSFQLSEKIDFYGTTIKAVTGYNTLTLSLYCMNRFLEPALEWFMVCLDQIIFPDSEIGIYQKNSLSRLRVSLEKTDYLADTAFRKALYGKDHPYGYETTETAIQNLTRDALLQYYGTQLRTDNAALFIAGHVEAASMQLIENSIGQWRPERAGLHKPEHAPAPAAEKHLRIPKAKSVQASIVIGKPMFNKHHPDYSRFILLNTVFGGYFGSRLMSNIREDKGLTYGIHSGLYPLKYSGYWAIYTDTNKKTLELCLGEIYHELRRLQEEVIPDDELKLARNYVMGRFLSRTDGPFSRMETFKSYFIEGAGIDSFQQYVEDIKAADALSLQRLAQQHLAADSLYEIVAG